MQLKTIGIGCFLTFFSLCTLNQYCLAQTQEEIRSLEKSIDDYSGIERLKLLNQLSSYFYNKNNKKALKYGKQAVSLSKLIFSEGNPAVLNQTSRKEKLLAYLQLGLIYYKQEKYNRAKGNMEVAEAQFLDDSIFISQTSYYLEQIDTLAAQEGFFARNLKPLNLGEAINSKSDDIKISTTLRLAKKYEKNEHYTKAIEQYKRAINLLRNKGEGKQVAELRTKIAELYSLEGKTDRVSNCILPNG